MPLLLVVTARQGELKSALKLVNYRHLNALTECSCNFLYFEAVKKEAELSLEWTGRAADIHRPVSDF